jgi:glycosyltransferase involved in cell wall biosynthesis
MSKVLISTVTPVYSGADYLEKLIIELDYVKQTWQDKKYPLELIESIFVCDDPIDNSVNILRNLEKHYHWIKIIELSKNYGQHPATIAGILHSSGDWVVTLDEDLQHHPKYILTLLQQGIQKKADIVYANSKTAHKSWFRDFSSRTYKKLISFLTNSVHVRHFNSFRLIRGSLARASASVAGHEMYLDVVFGWFTNRVTAKNIQLSDERYQQEGKSGYNFRRLLRHAWRLLVSAQTKILRMVAVLGLLAVLTALGFGLFILIGKLFFAAWINIQGWASLMMTLLFFGGLISFMLGILLEYVSIILLQSQGKPTFFVVDRSLDDLIIEWLKHHSERS